MSRTSRLSQTLVWISPWNVIIFKSMKGFFCDMNFLVWLAVVLLDISASYVFLIQGNLHAWYMYIVCTYIIKIARSVIKHINMFYVLRFGYFRLGITSLGTRDHNNRFPQQSIYCIQITDKSGHTNCFLLDFAVFLLCYVSCCARFVS